MISKYDQILLWLQEAAMIYMNLLRLRNPAYETFAFSEWGLTTNCDVIEPIRGICCGGGEFV